ncbi:hypothetical protein [Streptomyces jumonjinensis]|uniref:Uncharacterized protein n=1 Tax=Streptomyces jumonjinensis TaxID=1945 RepID=A0A646KA13_STRJU|nr:hypothetical protein [Streptomyces jumonjinensis]MQS99034.1 hypothetical protein [Streptomyces jumonjinensis]
MAIDNGAADDEELHVLALGLLTLLLRAKDGDDVTVEGISKRRKEGREALAGAMRNLVSRAYVVKFKIHGVDAKWRTEFSADSIRFTRDDVAAMIAEIEESGCRSVRVEPEWIDPREDGGRPTETRRSSATSKNKASSQVAPTYGFPAVGASGVGASAAKKIKTGEEEDSLSGAGGVSDPGEREAAAPEGSGADVVVDAYVQALGRPLLNGSREQLRSQAEQLLAVGYAVAWLAARAAEMPALGYRDLVQHAQHPRHRLPGQAGPTGAAAPGGERPSATAEQVAALRARIAERGSGL